MRLGELKCMWEMCLCLKSLSDIDDVLILTLFYGSQGRGGEKKRFEDFFILPKVIKC